MFAAEDLALVYVNATFERVFGLSRATLDSDPDAWVLSVHEHDRPRVREELRARRSGATPQNLGEFRIRAPSGELRWLRGAIRRLEATAGDRPGTYWVETVFDVSAERERAKARRIEEQVREGLVELLGALVFTSDAEGRLTWWNGELAALHGAPAVEVSGWHLGEVLSPGPDPVGRFQATLATMPSSGRFHVGVRRMAIQGGGGREVDWWVVPMRDDEGKLVAFIGLGHDVTAELDHARALRASDERFGELLHNLPGVPWLFSLGTRAIEYVGPTFERLWGRPPPSSGDASEALVAWLHPEDRAAVVEAALSTLHGDTSTPSDVEYRVVRPDGSVRWQLTRAVPVRDAQGMVAQVAGFTVDVTPKRETERALRESEERFRQIAESSREVFFLISADYTRLYYINPAAEQLWGLPRELLYADPRQLIDAIHPDDHAEVTRQLARRRAGHLPLELNLEYRIIRADRSLRWISTRTYPVLESDGSIQRIVGLDADITDRKLAEQALRERSEQLERLLREKNVLLAEVHHRVKNNLQSISGLMQLMAAQAHRRPLSETIAELERRIQAMALVHETLYRSSTLTAVDMQSYFDRVGQALLAAVDGASCALGLRVHAQGVTMEIENAARCGLIVSELIGNSAKHAFRGRSSGQIEVVLTCARGEGCTLVVDDDGTGLPQKVDFSSEATLGLRLVRGLAEQMGGSVRRVPGPRSAVEVRLPNMSK